MKSGLFNILAVCAFVSACSTSNQTIEVVDHKAPFSTKVLYHVVAPGETLYTIAWRYNLDYKNLAKANNIGRNYLIHPGQKIRLDSSVAHQSTPKTDPPPRLSSITSPVPNTKTTSFEKPAGRLEKASPVVNKSTANKNSSFSNTWLWPLRGEILEKFESNRGLHKGIDIGGKLGEPVHSAAAGEVVYAGEGLRGYGKLIIIKHSDKYLSAYGHNKKVLVREGEKVTAGQKVALLGSTGTDRVKLHFEIRYEGQPIDPISKLPKY